jgi:hypothetical protein
VNLTGLETLLLSDTFKITDLDIHRSYGGPYFPMMGFQRVLQALGRCPALTKLGLRGCPLGRGEARQLGMVLCNTPSLQTLVLKDSTVLWRAPSLQTLVLKDSTLASAELGELAPALYRNTTIKVLDMSDHNFNSI